MDFDFDSKYGHLTKPLKEAAMCWNIDLQDVIGSFLQTENDENHSMDPKHMMNFAQAGMLVSSTTTNYSRKVEHLYTLVYTTLDSLSKGEGKSLASSSIMKKLRKRLVGFQEFEAGFEMLDSQFEEPVKGIDVSGGTVINDDENHNTQPSHVIRRVPLLLLPREDSDGKKDLKQSSGGAEYKSSKCTTSKSGCLLLDPSFSVFEDFDNIGSGGRGSMGGKISMQGPLIPGAANLPEGSGVVLSVVPIIPDLDSSLFVDTSTFDDSTPPVVDDNPVLAEEEEAMADLAIAAVDSTPSPTRQYPALPPSMQSPFKSSAGKSRLVDDPWKLLDPHSSASMCSRKLKVGQCWVEPPELKLLSEMKFEDEEGCVNLSGNILRIFDQKVSLKLKEIREVRRKAAQAKKLAADSESEQETAGRVSFVGGGRMSGRMSIAQSHDGRASPPPVSLVPLPSREERYIQLDRERTALLEKVLESSKRDYDEFMQRMMPQQHEESGSNSAAMTTAASHAVMMSDKIPELYATIRKWQDNLEPLLEEQNSHPAFDLDDYLSSIIDKLRVETAPADGAIAEFLRNAGMAGDDSSEDEELEGAISGTSSFSDLVKGQPKWNVCRLFLSTLILTNNGNIDIDKSEIDESTAANFSIFLKNANKNLKLAVEDNSVGIVVARNLPKPEPIGDVPFAEE